MRTLIATACFTALLGASALAPASAAVMTTSKTTQKATSSSRSGPRTAASLDCSKQADAKNLHGKDREKFRKSCMKTAK